MNLSKFTRPSLAEYSQGYYQVAPIESICNNSYKLIEQWEIPVLEFGEIVVHGVRLVPSQKAKIKVYFGSKSKRAVVWSEDQPYKIMGVTYDCYGLKFKEQGDTVSDETIEKYLVDNTSHGVLYLSFTGVSVDCTDESWNLHLSKPEEYLSWTGSERFYPSEIDQIFQKIAKQVHCTVPRRVFVQCDWQLEANNKQNITSRKTSYLKICRDLSIVEYDSASDLIKAAEQELKPCAEILLSKAKCYAVRPDSEYPCSNFGDEPYNEKTSYHFGGYWRVRNYTNRGQVERQEIAVSVLTPW
jgi:hypothetical protein